MNRILSLDLGTASIGWAVREKTADRSIADIVASGVVIFPEGYGTQKGNQFSLASARRVKRLIRRGYYRRKLRKYAALKVLIENGMAPLTIAELRAWIKPERGVRSEYPTSELFHKWLRLIPANGPLRATAFANVYQLRAAATNGKLGQLVQHGFSEEQLLGRIVYNFAQRRGFLSNAKDNRATSETGKVKEGIKNLRADMGGKTMAEYFATLNPFEERIRGRFLGRDMFQEEFNAICAKYPAVLAHLKEGFERALYHVRPLKSQKDKVGGCTFEKDKTRIPLSHPEFELFRLRQFLQNVRIIMGNPTLFGAEFASKGTKGGKKDEIPLAIIDKVIDRIVSEKSGKLTMKALQDLLAKEMDRDLKLSLHEKVSIPSCPTCRLMYHVLGNDWQNRKLHRTVESGQRKGKVAEIGYLELWHFLREVAERPEKFTVENPVKDYGNKLGLDGEAIELMEDYADTMPAGYASMSLNAINRILPFMRDGHPYHVAVPIAGMKRVLGDDLWAKLGDELTQALVDAADTMPLEAARYRVYNQGLEELKNDAVIMDRKTIQDKLKFHLGPTGWKEQKALSKDFPESEVQHVVNMLSIAANDLEKASFKKIPNFQDFVAVRVEQELRSHLSLGKADIEKRLQGLYHHSAISKWKPAKVHVEPGADPENFVWQLDTPYTGAIQNPAAMRCLHETKKLVNYLLREKIIDERDTVVVEMARELNESNKRAGILEWQKIQKGERQRVREFLVEQMQGNNPGEDLIERTRLWLEQIEITEGDLQRQFLDKQLLGRELKGKKSDSIVTDFVLWREQKGICLYSGKQISPTDILNGIAVQSEHTIPLSRSNDSTMQNMTLSTAVANRDKGQRTPFEIGQGVGIVSDYQTILKRLQPWRDRVEYLQKQIDGKKKGIRGAKGSGDTDGYNKHVKERWVLRFERDYWRDKIERFELEEISSSFVRRQLVDTQVITKYATGWLKTVFKIVRGTKGSLTDELRHLWELQYDYEIKDRTNHTHHLIDAVVNAFIEPGLYNRLAAFYREREQGDQRRAKLDKPWETFREDVKELCERTLVYHVYRDRLNVQSKFKYRDRNGTVHFKTGQSVKGMLHKDTALANVRTWENKDGETLWKRNSEGGFDRIYVTRKDVIDKLTKAVAKPHFSPMEEYIDVRKDEYKTGGNQRILPVYKLRLKDGKRARILGMTEADLHNLKENDLNAHFLNEVAKSSLEEVQENGFFLPVRKVRVAKAVTQPPKVRDVQKAFQHPNRPEKHGVYYENESNYALAIYRNHDGKKEKQTFRLIRTIDAIGKTDEELFEPSVDEKGLTYLLGGINHGNQIFKMGAKVLLYEKSPDEIWDDLSNINTTRRLHVVSGLSSMTIHRPTKSDRYGTINVELHNQTGKFINEKSELEDHKIHKGAFDQKADPIAKRFFLHGQINALIEGIDFQLSYDGIIIQL